MELKKFARELRSNMTDAERHLWYYLRGHRLFGLSSNDRCQWGAT